uniref:translation initiation factor IF-2-like n=1 Tax=Jaculus jaculus TaxID=51337 RepID=UPI001E1B1B45|nr:translation initiation factor IF-2-like [Jaculus jaculus]
MSLTRGNPGAWSSRPVFLGEGGERLRGSWECLVPVGAQQCRLFPSSRRQVDRPVPSQLRRASSPPSGQSVKYKFKFRANAPPTPILGEVGVGVESYPAAFVLRDRRSRVPSRAGPGPYPRPAEPRCAPQEPPPPAGVAPGPRVPATRFQGATEGPGGSGWWRGRGRERRLHSEPVGASLAPPSQLQTPLGPGRTPAPREAERKHFFGNRKPGGHFCEKSRSPFQSSCPTSCTFRNLSGTRKASSVCGPPVVLYDLGKGILPREKKSLQRS